MISNPRNLHPTAGLKVSDFTDIKPSNILLEPNKQGFRPKVTDFGIAKVTDAANAVVKKKGSTLAEARMGTPCYMSPEPVRAAKNVTNRSDIFSLGATLYELATLQTAFDGDSDYDIMHRIVESRYVPAENVGVDATIAAAIAKALQADPERRFASCEKFIEALSVPVRASVPPQPSPPAPVPAPVLVSTPPPVQPVASAPFVRPPLPSPTPPCAPATVEPARRPPPGRAKAAAPSRPQRSAFVSRASVLTLAVGAAYVAWPYIKREVRISREPLPATAGSGPPQAAAPRRPVRESWIGPTPFSGCIKSRPAQRISVTYATVRRNFNDAAEIRSWFVHVPTELVDVYKLQRKNGTRLISFEIRRERRLDWWNKVIGTATGEEVCWLLGKALSDDNVGRPVEQRIAWRSPVWREGPRAPKILQLAES